MLEVCVHLGLEASVNWVFAIVIASKYELRAGLLVCLKPQAIIHNIYNSIMYIC